MHDDINNEPQLTIDENEFDHQCRFKTTNLQLQR